MTAKRAAAAGLGGFLFAVAGIAAASNFVPEAQDDFFTAGAHQFHVWCPGAGDYTATAKGANAEEAQMKLYKAAQSSGRSGCWPVWQGKIPG